MSEKSRRKSQKKATGKYVREHYDRLSLNLKKGEKLKWQEQAENLGFDSLSAFIRYCVEKQIGTPPGNC